MKPLTIIYWTRAGLGVVVAAISALLSFLVPDITLLNGVTVALFIYVLTYYAYKSIFLTKVDKSSKIFTTGVGAYFLTWIVAWTLFYTIYVHS